MNLFRRALQLRRHLGREVGVCGESGRRAQYTGTPAAGERGCPRGEAQRGRVVASSGEKQTKNVHLTIALRKTGASWVGLRYFALDHFLFWKRRAPDEIQCNSCFLIPLEMSGWVSCVALFNGAFFC